MNFPYSKYLFVCLLLLQACAGQEQHDQPEGLAEDEFTRPFRINTGKTVAESPLKRGSEQSYLYDDPMFLEHDTSLLHQAISTETWDILNLLEYEKEFIEGTPWYVPVFPPQIRQLEGTVIDLKGYMVPLEPGNRHSNFLISVLPLLQCHFCGQGGIPEMVEVFTNESLRYTESIITVSGKLRLNNSDPNHFTFILDDARKR